MVGGGRMITYYDVTDLIRNAEQLERLATTDPLTGLANRRHFLTALDAEWSRFDLYLNADPWAAARLRRCAHRINFFHGVAGKYDLDRPTGIHLHLASAPSVS